MSKGVLLISGKIGFILPTSNQTDTPVLQHIKTFKTDFQ